MGVEVPRRAEYLRVIWHELFAHPFPRAVDGPGRRRVRLREPVHALLAPARARAGHLREDHRRTRHLLGRAGRAAWCDDIDDAQMARDQAACCEGIKDDYRQICDAFLKDCVREEPHGGRGLHHATRTRWPRAWSGPFARATANVNYDARMLGNGGYGELSDFQPVAGLTEGDCYARVKVRALGGAAVHRHHRGDDGQDPRRRHRRAREGRPRGGRAGRQRAWSSPAASATTTRAATGRSTWSACACARPPRRTSPA